MPVVDIRITKLEANLEKPKQVPKAAGIKITNNSRVKDIKKTKVPGLGEAIIVDFEYETKYEPSVGSIVVGGSLIFHDKKLKDHIKIEKGNVMLKGDAYAEVQNAILGSGTINALILAKEIKLPPPIQLPSVSLVDKKDKKGDKSYA